MGVAASKTRRLDRRQPKEIDMTPATPALAPASDLAQHGLRLPNESAEYRRARTALLAAEIELRRQIEAVAAQRRALPPGGEVPEDYLFESEDGLVRFSQLFGSHDTLVVYSFMFGPRRERPCPMCTSLLSAWDGEMADMLQRVSVAVVAESPIERLTAFKRERGWRHLRLYSTHGSRYNHDYHGIAEDGGDDAAINVFTKAKDGTLRHFWAGEMGAKTADPGQDPRGAPDLMPLWTVLDLTPAGRAPDWYPELEYGPVRATTRD
jgi:predicted dithiol-disulfide oxidoreductase (DUF899 family)